MAFPFPFGAVGEAAVVWVTFFLDGAISVARGCFKVLDGENSRV